MLKSRYAFTSKRPVSQRANQTQTRILLYSCRQLQVSTTAPEYTHRTIRLIQGLDAPHAPEVQSEEISSIPTGRCKGRFQEAHPGSYALVQGLGLTTDDDGVRCSLYLQATLVKAGHDQTIVSVLGTNGSDGVVAVINVEGGLELRIGDGNDLVKVPTGYTFIEKQWVHLDFEVKQTSVDVTLTPVTYLGHKRGGSYRQTAQLAKPVSLATSEILTLAATRPSLDERSTDCFNGRIDGLSLTATGAAERSVLKLDFYQRMGTDTVVDASGAGRDGILVNAPTRAVTGHDWDGSETDWTKASHGYGAIHFHEEDLDDARWATDFTIRIPPDARSGAYSVEVRNTDDPSVMDNITFFVRPHPDSTAKAAVVLSTFTYTAYANEHMYDEEKSSQLVLTGDLQKRTDENFLRMERRSDIGLSMYDVHRDGSGTVFSSSKRPILNVRPGFYHWGFDRPREFSADLFMIGFLEKLGISYDVVTDHDMHDKGVAAVERYTTIITGSHPEYPTLESLNAYSAFAARGGNIMYLGGNGFYWMSVVDPANPHRIEVRRCDQGVRTFGMGGGEWHHSLNGRRGGLWRSRGRAANHLVGIGCCGEGFGPGKAYKQADGAKGGKYAWVFEGIAEGELIGEEGFGGGASGDEIDRWDPVNGSPANAVVLASSLRHSEHFGLFPEDVSFNDYFTGLLGPDTDKIRSDIVIVENPSGSMVFSVGSMNWYCSLAWDGYTNNVATMTANVVKKFTGTS